MKAHQQLLKAACSLALAFSVYTLGVTAMAQSPLADSFNPGANGTVYCLALQPDGKILVGGAFTLLGGQSCTNLGRLNPDGTADVNFNPGAVGTVYCLGIQTNGEILVAGQFTSLAGQACANIGRLNPDGTPDTAFNPGANGAVYCLALQADGEIVLGGQFTTLGGQSRAYLGRINPDGTLDGNFNPGANNAVNCLAVQPDGAIVVGGQFTLLGGQTLYHIGRLNADGSVQTSFAPGGSINSAVNCVALQGDGKILLGSMFTLVLQGKFLSGIARLNADGTLDNTFTNTVGAIGVFSFITQADGRIMVGGQFNSLGSDNSRGIGRLNSNGAVESAFNPDLFGSSVNATALQSDGSILIAGQFSHVGSLARSGIARLINTDPAVEALSYDGATLTWTRSGTAPEVWRTTFEYSTNNGVAWIGLGAGVRISGGWQLAGLSLPLTASFRARGYVNGGYRNGSSWFEEADLGLLQVLAQPLDVTSNATSTVTFTVRAAGSGTLGFQWSKNGGVLVDGGNVSGSGSRTLTLSNVLGSDEGNYSVVVSNGSVGVTSEVATLTVIDPAIAVQPVSQTKGVGDGVTFTVGAIGTSPLFYQWLKDGAVLAGATQASLTLTNLQLSDSGVYDVAISNIWGNASSTTAVLSVSLALADSFNPGTDRAVSSLAVQTDGKILVGGGFGSLAGQSRSHLGRLNADGTLDPNFNPGANGSVYSLALQSDGKILVAGLFTTLAGESLYSLGRLNADGTLDTGFVAGTNNTPFGLFLALQADGRTLVADGFTIYRFNSDGTADTNFHLAPALYTVVNSLTLQPDGKILAGGGDISIENGGGSVNSTNFARFNSDGSFDSGFVIGNNGSISSTLVQADGKILVGGGFSSLGGQSCNNLGRVNPDGSLDTSFAPQPNGGVTSLALQADGRIIVGGGFTLLGGQTCLYLGRLNSDGTPDPTFQPGPNDTVDSLALQADGEILVGGDFTTLGGQSRAHLGRLNNTDPASQSLTYNGSTLSWLRGGTTPEVWRTTFEYSPDGGISWTNIGAGARISGAWRILGLQLPANGTFRARGYVTGGDMVETVLLPTLMISGTANSGTGQFEFNGAGAFGQVVVVEFSPDLKNWMPLQTNTLGAGPLLISDPLPTSSGSRFYRLRAGQ